MHRLKQSSFAVLFTIYLRYLIGGAFVFASLVKVGGGRFFGADGSSAPIHSVPHFFETLYQSGLYWQFLGLAQLLAGLVLMTQQFAALGAVLFYPIVLNVFVITVSYDFGGTSFITGLMLLANTYLLLWDFDKFRPLFHLPCRETLRSDIENRPVWTWTGLLLFAVTLALGMAENGRNLNFLAWAAACTGIGLCAWGYWLWGRCKRNRILKADCKSG